MRLIAMGVPATGQNKGKANHHPQKDIFRVKRGKRKLFNKVLICNILLTKQYLTFY